MPMRPIKCSSYYSKQALVLLLCPCVTLLWTTFVLAECSDPALFRELSQMSVHEKSARVRQHRNLMRECQREIWKKQNDAAQEVLESLRSEKSRHAFDPPGHDRIHHHDQLTDMRSRFDAVGEKFPPQPKNRKNIQYDRSNGLRGSERKREENQKVVASRLRAVKKALGNRYVYVGHEALESKEKQRSQDRLTYFSHANNATVEVLMNQESLIGIHQIPPEIYQPPLTEHEASDAIRIAREALVADGFSKVTELEGHTILALPTDNGSAFFPHRMGYVSFHANIDVSPEIVAWVDLTNQVVVKSREE